MKCADANKRRRHDDNHASDLIWGDHGILVYIPQKICQKLCHTTEDDHLCGADFIFPSEKRQKQQQKYDRLDQLHRNGIRLDDLSIPQVSDRKRSRIGETPTASAEQTAKLCYAVYKR